MTPGNLVQFRENPANSQVADPQKASHNPKVAGSNPAPAIERPASATFLVPWLGMEMGV